MLLNLAYTTSFIVGLVFLLTGIAKVIEPWKFIRHIGKLGLLKPVFIAPISITFIAIESALGIALIFRVFLEVTIPLSILLLIGLSILTYWSTSTGKTEDCGCYNGWLEVSPTQSLILNSIYIALLILAEFLGKYQPTVLWQWVAVLITFLTSYALTAGSYEYFKNSGRPYIDFSPLQENKIWQLEWLGEDSKSLMSGSVILVFMSPQCPQCKNWLKVLKFLQWQDNLPSVAGVVALNNVDEAQDFVDNYALNFPVAVVDKKLYEKLRIEAVPTAVVLEDGVIQDKWIGTMPVWFVDQIRQINQRQMNFELNPRSGYTLPVFACAAAVAALRWVRQNISSLSTVSINLLEPAEIVDIPIEQVALLKNNTALAITRSDPGNNLDLTHNTPVWAMVEFATISPTDASEQIVIIGGAGIGLNINSGEAAIYSYARRLLQENLQPLLDQNEQIKVTIILPEGRQLATRTSNSAFGIVEGLSLLGTTGLSQPLSIPGQLEAYQEELQQKAVQFNSLVFCIGENGLDIARKMGISSQQIVKTANWLGPMLVAAAIAGVKSILLLGYHGKLIKLAGGIFHTHHYLADGRLEILTAHCANIGLPTSVLQEIFACNTAEDALKLLRNLDTDNQNDWVGRVYRAIASKIDQRCQAYIFNHSQKQVQVGSMLFDRDRQIFLKTEVADTVLQKIC